MGDLKKSIASNEKILLARKEAIEAISKYVDLAVSVRDCVDEIDVVTALFAKMIRGKDIYSENKRVIEGSQIKGHPMP